MTSAEFTQTDPLQADVGSAYPSAYVYGNNNPLMYVDPSGLRGIKADVDIPVVDTAPDALALVVAVKKPAPERGGNRKPPTKRNPTPACVRGVQTAVLPVPQALCYRPLQFGRWGRQRE